MHQSMRTIPVSGAAAAVFAVLLAGAAPLAAAAPAAKAKAAAAEPAGRTVEYQELEQQVGAVIAVETNLNTVRRGVLVKYTNPTLTLRLGPEAGSIDLSVPHDSIRRITLITPAPAPGAPPQGSRSAEKN